MESDKSVRIFYLINRINLIRISLFYYHLLLNLTLSNGSISVVLALLSPLQVNESLAAKCERIKQFADAEEKLLVQTSAELINSIGSANESQTGTVASITSALDSCATQLNCLTNRIHDAEASVNTLVLSTSEAAKNCKTSENGVCKKLSTRYSQWESIGRTTDSNVDTISVDFFKDTVNCSKKLFERNEAEMTESVGRLGDTLNSVQTCLPGFDDVSGALSPRLPLLLSEHLSKTVHGYVPTGKTPSRKNVAYPKNLTRTARHSQLLSEFRQAHGFPLQESPLVDLTNTDRQSSSSCFIPNPTSPECEVENECVPKSESRASSGVVSFFAFLLAFSGVISKDYNTLFSCCRVPFP